jgi:transcription elongation factor GreA
MSVEPTSDRPVRDRDGGRAPAGIVLTVSGWRALQDALTRRRAAKAQEIAERLREARAFGEASVNDDYLSIQEEEALLEAGISALERLVETAVILGDPQPNGDIVNVGTVVTVAGLNGRTSATYEVVGSLQAERPGVVSAGSPVGRALMGRAAGDSVEVELPGGRLRKLEVLAIDPSTG